MILLDYRLNLLYPLDPSDSFELHVRFETASGRNNRWVLARVYEDGSEVTRRIRIEDVEVILETKFRPIVGEGNW